MKSLFQQIKLGEEGEKVRERKDGQILERFRESRISDKGKKQFLGQVNGKVETFWRNVTGCVIDYE